MCQTLRRCTVVEQGASNHPATRNRTRDHLIAAAFYSQMLYQLSYSRLTRDALCFLYHGRPLRQRSHTGSTQPYSRHDSIAVAQTPR